MRHILLPAAAICCLVATAGCGGAKDAPSPAPVSQASSNGATATAQSTPASASPYPVSSLSAPPVTEVAHLPFRDTDAPTGSTGGVPAVLHVVSLRATGRTAVLTFWVTAPQANLLRPLDAFDPAAWPTLRIGNTTYTVDTYARRDGTNRCICSDPPRLDGNTVKPMDATFTLPEQADRATVGIQGATGTITVPITR